MAGMPISSWRSGVYVHFGDAAALVLLPAEPSGEMCEKTDQVYPQADAINIASVWSGYQGHGGVEGLGVRRSMSGDRKPTLAVVTPGNVWLKTAS